MDASIDHVLISGRGLTKIYRMGEVEVPALRHTDLDVLEGELLVVVGPSGSGKSTLLHIIGGMDRPSSGTLYFEGRRLTGATERELTLFRRRQVGFVFQFFNLVPTLTALENVQVVTELVEHPLDPTEALRRVGLQERADHFPAQLSGGEQQRVAIGRALAGQPRLLLCDEPTGALDQQTGKQVLALLADLRVRHRQTVVIITHNRAITRIADRVAEIRDGQIVMLASNEHPEPVERIQW